MNQIAATLGLKEMSQSVLMRKICTLSGHHRTRKAIFEYDKLIRSIYTLRYLRDPQLQRDVHRSENRIESYHLATFHYRPGERQKGTDRAH